MRRHSHEVVTTQPNGTRLHCAASRGSEAGTLARCPDVSPEDPWRVRIAGAGGPVARRCRHAHHSFLACAHASHLFVRAGPRTSVPTALARVHLFAGEEDDAQEDRCDRDRRGARRVGIRGRSHDRQRRERNRRDRPGAVASCGNIIGSTYLLSGTNVSGQTATVLVNTPTDITRVTRVNVETANGCVDINLYVQLKDSGGSNLDGVGFCEVTATGGLGFNELNASDNVAGCTATLGTPVNVSQITALVVTQT